MNLLDECGQYRLGGIEVNTSEEVLWQIFNHESAQIDTNVFSCLDS